MRLFLFISLLAGLFSLCKGQDSAYHFKVVETLSSPAFKGRGYTESGDARAAEFILDEFRSIGLEPVGKTYDQPFSIQVNVFPGDMFCSINNIVLTPGKDFLVDPASGGVHRKFKVLTVPKHFLTDEAGVKEIVTNLKGRFLIIDERNDSLLGKEELQKANEVIARLKYDPAFKNAGTAILTNQKLTFGSASFSSGKPSLVINHPDVTGDIRTIRLRMDAGLIDYTSRNLIGYIRGTVKPDSFLVITAHYDHLGMMGRDVYFPGANDNASGVAMLLSLARYFSASPPAYTMVFIAFSGEETGITGAKAFTDNPLFDLAKIRFLINFDLAGTGEEGIKVVNGSVFRDQFNLLKKLNEDTGLLPSVQARGEACNSDHCAFYEKGVPCFYIYTLGGIKAYHDIYDRYETLPMTEFNDYLQLMTLFLQKAF